MNHLFIQFYLDEDVSILVAELIRARGFTITTTREAGQGGRSDEEQLNYAVSRRATLVTHNRADFEFLAPILQLRPEALRNSHRRTASNS